MKTRFALCNEDRMRYPIRQDRGVHVTVFPSEVPSGKVRITMSQLCKLPLLRHALLLCPLLILVLFGCVTSETSFTPEREATTAPRTESSLASDSETSIPQATEQPLALESEILNVVVPPCTPYPGSRVDPCERRDTWPQLNPYVSVSYEYPQPVPTLEELYLSIIDTEQYLSAPQFVVRAIPIPGSTRCGTFSSFGSEFTAFSGNRDGASDHTRCWVDLAVNEYIINSGPARLTIDIGVWIPNLDREELANDARVFGERFEGWEWVITLNGPIDPNNASWRMRWRQDVQMREDGSVVVVAWSKKDYMLISPPEFRSINLQRLETTLPEYRRIAKSAYEKFFERTGGRIMVGNDINGNPLPHLAKDATDASLRNYIGEVKVVDASEYTMTWPPPAPDENGLNPDGLTVNDIIATRVAGGIRLPGGLEDTPTPVSALGDEPTATTEHAAESTTTANPDPIATPELEDTPAPETAIQRRRTSAR